MFLLIFGFLILSVSCGTHGTLIKLDYGAGSSSRLAHLLDGDSFRSVPIYVAPFSYISTRSPEQLYRSWSLDQPVGSFVALSLKKELAFYGADLREAPSSDIVVIDGRVSHLSRRWDDVNERTAANTSSILHPSGERMLVRLDIRYRIRIPEDAAPGPWIRMHREARARGKFHRGFLRALKDANEGFLLSDEGKKLLSIELKEGSSQSP